MFARDAGVRSIRTTIGETLVIDLGFATQLYGYEYDQITVSTNGYIAMGDQEGVGNFQNWPLDRAMAGGVGMVAPFWDWLRFTDNSDIFYYFDEDDHRGIIEWHRLRHKEGGNTDLTFEVILYDKDVWVTETGDPNILFQYASIGQVRGPRTGGEWENNVDFASVGISSPDGNSGINYTFHNEYPVTSAPLENGRALLFSTSPRYKACILYGHVTDAATGRPVENAIIFTKHGFTAFTDTTGYWRMGDALAEVPFDITAMKQGYNDSTEFDLNVEEDDSLEINFNLLHPEFTPTTYRLSAMLDPGLQTELQFTVANTGNGPLDWQVERRLIGDANAQPWEYRRPFYVGQAVDDDHMEGVVFVEDHFFVVGGNDNMPTIYKFDRDGALVDTFPQFDLEDRRGMRDLAWDGDLIWGSLSRTIYGFTTDGELSVSFEAPFRPVTAVTYDPRLDVLWIAGTTTNIRAVTREGEEIDSLEISRNDMRTYGLGYYRDDPDNFPLYVFHKERETDRQVVHKSDPLNGDTAFVAYLETELDASPAGLFITNQYDVYSWVFVCIASASRNAGSDRIDIWQVDARRDWYQVDLVTEMGRVPADTVHGRIDPGESMDYVLALNSTGLPDTLFEAELYFTHNADSGRGHIHVELDVIGPMPPFPFDLASPADNDTLDSTLAVFQWMPSFDPNDGENVSFTAWIMAGEDSIDIPAADTSLAIDLDTLGFDLETMYEIPSTWWVKAVSGVDTIESNQRHHFWIRRPDWAGESDNQIPVDFAIRSIYPSPFNSTTTIRFGADRAERTIITLYDLAGREVARLYDEVPTIGYHSVVFDGNNLPSGLYIIRLGCSDRVKVAKTALVR